MILKYKSFRDFTHPQPCHELNFGRLRAVNLAQTRTGHGTPYHRTPHHSTIPSGPGRRPAGQSSPMTWNAISLPLTVQPIASNPACSASGHARQTAARSRKSIRSALAPHPPQLI